MRIKMSEVEWRENNENIAPVYFRFDTSYVSNDSDNLRVEIDSYRNNMDAKLRIHQTFMKSLYPFPSANIPKQTEELLEHQKCYDRYTKVYEHEGSYGQIKLQMEYEFGMSPDDMKNETSIINYLMKHKLIKFGNVNDTNNDAIDGNDHLKDNQFKYSCHWAERNDKLEFKNDQSGIDICVRDLSSGERIYFNLLLWSLIHKVNKKLLKEGHNGLVRNGAKFVFLLGKIL